MMISSQILYDTIPYGTIPYDTILHWISRLASCVPREEIVSHIHAQAHVHGPSHLKNQSTGMVFMAQVPGEYRSTSDQERMFACVPCCGKVTGIFGLSLQWIVRKAWTLM